MSILFVNLKEVLGTQFLLTNVTGDSSDGWCPGSLLWLFFNVNVMHLQHVNLHEVLVTQFFIADVAVVLRLLLKGKWRKIGLRRVIIVTTAIHSWLIWRQSTTWRRQRRRRWGRKRWSQRIQSCISWSRGRRGRISRVMPVSIQSGLNVCWLLLLPHRESNRWLQIKR